MAGIWVQGLRFTTGRPSREVRFGVGNWPSVLPRSVRPTDCHPGLDPGPILRWRGGHNRRAAHLASPQDGPRLSPGWQLVGGVVAVACFRYMLRQPCWPQRGRYLPPAL